MKPVWIFEKDDAGMIVPIEFSCKTGARSSYGHKLALNDLNNK